MIFWPILGMIAAFGGYVATMINYHVLMIDPVAAVIVILCIYKIAR